MGQFNRRPLLVHGFTLSAFDTRVELPDRDAKHPKDEQSFAGICTVKYINR
jgi:hypothetical protein